MREELTRQGDADGGLQLVPCQDPHLCHAQHVNSQLYLLQLNETGLCRMSVIQKLLSPWLQVCLSPYGKTLDVCSIAVAWHLARSQSAPTLMSCSQSCPTCS